MKKALTPALGLLVTVAVAHAGTVRGTLTLPADPHPAEQTGHWRVDNGILPVLPRARDLKSELVVVLEGGSGRSPSALTIELHGLRMDPKLLVVEPGQTVQFKNSDRVPHILHSEGGASVMAAEPTPAGQTRAQRFDAIGEFRIRDEEFPHIEGAVLVVKAPYVASVDDKGTFRTEVPEGKYLLRVFWRGAWVVSQPLEVGVHTTEVGIQVPPQKRGERGRGE